MKLDRQIGAVDFCICAVIAGLNRALSQVSEWTPLRGGFRTKLSDKGTGIDGVTYTYAYVYPIEWPKESCIAIRFCSDPDGERRIDKATINAPNITVDDVVLRQVSFSVDFFRGYVFYVKLDDTSLNLPSITTSIERAG